MPIFDPNSPYHGSGSPMVWGGQAFKQPNSTVRRKGFKFDRTRDIVVEPSSTPAYFNVLNGRYDVDPSGWNS